MDISIGASFVAIALAHAVAVLSPGPDLLLVVQHSVSFGRPRVYYTCLGIGSGILTHCVYALTGLSLLVYAHPLISTLVTWAGAAVMLWLGWEAWRAQKIAVSKASTKQPLTFPNVGKLWIQGFLTNAFNAKAVVLFFTLFSVVNLQGFPFWVQIAVVVYLALATALIFMTLARVATHPPVLRFLENCFWA